MVTLVTNRVKSNTDMYFNVNQVVRYTQLHGYLCNRLIPSL